MDNEKEGELLLPQERREYPRVAVNVKVKYRVLTEDEADTALTRKFDSEKIFAECGQARALNVSSSGLLMYTEEEIAPKKFMAVNMYLPMPGLSCSCRALCEVMRCEKKENGYETGVKFLKILHHSLNKYKFITLEEVLDISGDNIKLD